MARLYDRGSVVMLADFTNAINDAMHGKASEVLKALNDNGEIPIKFYNNGLYQDDENKLDLTAKVTNVSGSNRLLDYIFSFTIPSSYESPLKENANDRNKALTALYKDASGTTHELFDLYSIAPIHEAMNYVGQTGSFEVRIVV